MRRHRNPAARRRAAGSVQPNPATIADGVPDPPDMSPGGRPLRILIVEDEPAIAGAVKAVLVTDGHAVDIVGDGGEALDWAATLPVRPRAPRRHPARARRLCGVRRAA